MHLVKLSPFRNSVDFPHGLNTLFDHAFFNPHWTEGGSKVNNWNPCVDVFENHEALVIKAEIPGVDKKDITVDFQGGVLVLKGERKREEETKEENYYRKERIFGKFQRTFKLPEDIDPEKIKADFKDGVLKIDIPKAEKQQPRQITVH